ncbi:MAG: FtsK/SpoIIIE domain-containing protein [Actinomycetota bacterium]|nr:FtsK/SpoIIIE domain-containing protein [Actinomycetota bacterium]
MTAPHLLSRWHLEAGLLALYVVDFLALGGKIGLSRASVVMGCVLLLLVVCSRSVRTELLPLLHRRHRLRLTQLRLHLALKERAPVVWSVDSHPAGELVTLAVHIGSSIPELERLAPVMAAALRARDVKVYGHREDQSLVDLVVVRRETLEREVNPVPLLGRYEPSLFDCVPLGIDEVGRHVVIGLVGRHLLIGGEPGSGKSVTLSAVLAAASRDPNCDIWCFDGKLVELAAWRPVAERFIGADVAEANEALLDLRTLMDSRYEEMEARGRRKVEKGDGYRTVLVVLDELAFYVANGDKKQGALFAERLRDVVARARAAGIVVVAATQKPSTDLVPSALRDNFGYRLAHRCATREASDTILGSGWATNDVSASSIAPKLRGVGYLLAEEGYPSRIRTMHLDDATISVVVDEALRLRGRKR